MNVASWLNQAKLKIPALDAELILLEVLGKTDRTWLVIYSEEILSQENIDRANNMVERRASGEPLAYILGYKEFYGRKFLVTKDTLIPRPETENIFDLIPEDTKIILDLGTGTGCIGITTKLEHPEKTVICSDVSEKALGVAKQNAKNLHADIKFVKSDLLDKITDQPDLIIANLPYVDPEWNWLDKPSLDYEPSLALYAKDHGLELIKKLIPDAKIRQVRWLILEADPCQHQDIIDFAKSHQYELVVQDHFILKLERIII